MQPALSPRNIFLAQIITYSGTLPLVVAILAQYLKVTQVDVLNLSRCYAALIICFICGVHWGIFLFSAAKCPHNMLITSSLVAFTALASVLLPDVKTALVMQSLCFLYLMVLDYRLKRAGVITTWYYALRHNVTAIMVFCLVMLELA